MFLANRDHGPNVDRLLARRRPAESEERIIQYCEGVVRALNRATDVQNDIDTTSHPLNNQVAF